MLTNAIDQGNYWAWDEVQYSPFHSGINLNSKDDVDRDSKGRLWGMCWQGMLCHHQPGLGKSGQPGRCYPRKGEEPDCRSALFLPCILPLPDYAVLGRYSIYRLPDSYLLPCSTIRASPIRHVPTRLPKTSRRLLSCCL